MNNIINLIQQARQDKEAYLVLLDLSEETGISFKKRKLKARFYYGTRSGLGGFGASRSYSGRYFQSWSSSENFPWSASGSLTGRASGSQFWPRSRCTSNNGLTY